MSVTNPRWTGDHDRVAIVLPGLAYTPDMSLLYWTAKALHQDGWSVRQVWWPDQPPSDRSEWSGWVSQLAAQAVEEVATQGVGVRVLLVGKSLGTLALPFAAQRSLSGIWLTPLLMNVPELGASLGELPRSLLVGGTADSTWDGRMALNSGHDVCEVEGADHAIEIEGDTSASLQALAMVVTAVFGYSDSLKT